MGGDDDSVPPHRVADVSASFSSVDIEIVSAYGRRLIRDEETGGSTGVNILCRLVLLLSVVSSDWPGRCLLARGEGEGGSEGAGVKEVREGVEVPLKVAYDLGCSPDGELRICELCLCGPLDSLCSCRLDAPTES